MKRNEAKNCIKKNWKHKNWYLKLRQIILNQDSVQLKKNPIPWSSSNRTSRYEEIIISRLKICHTRLTHSYLLFGLYSPPSCRYCHADEITVPHFFSCSSVQNIRKSFSVPSLLSLALSNNSETITDTLNFLRSTYFFNPFNPNPPPELITLSVVK